MKRRVLLVDDEVAVLLTLKAVLEISGFDVDTAASAREGRLKLRSNPYDLVITDMRLESEQAGTEVIQAARTAAYKPAIALLTAFPLAEEDWQEMGADRMLVKPMHTRMLLQQIESLLSNHQRQLANGLAGQRAASVTPISKGKRTPAKATTKKTRAASSAKSAALRKPVKKAAKKSPRKVAARKPLSKTAPKKARRG